MARGGEGGSARRENKPYITGAEAKVDATLKSDAITVLSSILIPTLIREKGRAMWMKSTLTLMVKIRRFKAISVYFRTHTKMVGGDYSQNEKAHTYSLG